MHYIHKHTIFIKEWDNGTKTFSIQDFYGNGFLKLVIRNNETKKFESPENLLKEIFKNDRELNNISESELPNDLKWIVLADDIGCLVDGCSGTDPFDSIWNGYAIIEDVESFKKTFSVLDVNEQNKLPRKGQVIEYNFCGLPA